MSTSEPFRLLDLPQEVRDEIYHGMLCDWPERHAGQHTMINGIVQFGARAHDMEPNILLANKQIYHEAKQVLLKANLFVHIRISVKDSAVIPAIFNPIQHPHIPVVAMGHYYTVRYKDLVVMTYHIKFPRDSSLQERNDDLSLILLHRDLGTFCEEVDRVNLYLRHFSAEPEYQITMYNPFYTTLSPDFLNSTIQVRIHIAWQVSGHRWVFLVETSLLTNVLLFQARLLSVFAKVHQGSGNFSIQGHIQPDLAQAVVARFRQEPVFPTPRAFLDDLAHEKELGNQAFNNGDVSEAYKHWGIARVMFYRARLRRAWPRLKQAGGKDFTDRVTELAFQVNNNWAQGYLVGMRNVVMREPWNRAKLDFWHKQLIDATSDASRMALILATDWGPSDEQYAKLCYRLAVAARLSGGRDLPRAEHFINFAISFLPGNPVIEAEAQEIERQITRLSQEIRRKIARLRTELRLG